MALTDKRYIYLAGKIKLGHGATGYRATVAPRLRDFGIHSLDPLRGKYTMKSWDTLDPNEVVVRDLQDIERAHIVLAVMMKYEDSSFGTPCEIMYAWERRIPVILITNERYLFDHFWPKSLCSHVFFVDEAAGNSFDGVLSQAVEHIGHWYGTTIEDEVYTDPQVAQEATVACANTAPIKCDVVDGHCNTHDCSAGHCPQVAQEKTTALCGDCGDCTRSGCKCGKSKCKCTGSDRADVTPPPNYSDPEDSGNES